MSQTDQDIALHRVQAWVCDLCLSGAGGECHVPGCAFWCHDAPTGDAVAWWQGMRERTPNDERSGGYVVAGPDVEGSANPGRLVADWDGEVHLTHEAGDVALAECHRSGYRDWQLYALVPVAALDAVRR